MYFYLFRKICKGHNVHGLWTMSDGCSTHLHHHVIPGKRLVAWQHRLRCPGRDGEFVYICLQHPDALSGHRQVIKTNTLFANLKIRTPMKRKGLNLQKECSFLLRYHFPMEDSSESSTGRFKNNFLKVMSVLIFKHKIHILNDIDGSVAIWMWRKHVLNDIRM